MENKKLIDKAIGFIQQNFQSNLSLQSIADESTFYRRGNSQPTYEIIGSIRFSVDTPFAVPFYVFRSRQRPATPSGIS